VESILAHASRADIQLEPFPHIVLRDVLEEAVCDRLIAEFPPLESMVGWDPDASNKRLYYRAKTAMHDSGLSPLWRETIETHVSQVFLEQLVQVFGESVLATYPDFEERFGHLDSLRAGMRFRDSFDDADVLIEAQPSANPPVTAEPTSVRAGHLDNPNKLFVGLFYLRHPDDDSTGGDLELYRYGPGRPVFDDHEIADRHIEPVKTIPYEKNVLVMFMNSPQALHGVTVRQKTRHPRLFLNLNAEVSSDLFAMPGQMRTRVVRRALRAVPQPLRKSRARLVAAAFAVLVVLTMIFVVVPEELGDKPYNVF